MRIKFRYLDDILRWNRFYTEKKKIIIVMLMIINDLSNCYNKSNIDSLDNDKMFPAHSIVLLNIFSLIVRVS